MKNISIISTVLIILLVSLLSGCPDMTYELTTVKNNPAFAQRSDMPKTFAPVAGDTWTFMIYMDGDNNLEPHAIEDINEMEYGLYNAYSGIDANLNIIVLFDKNYYDDDEGYPDEWTDTRIFKIEPDSDSSKYGTIVSQEIFDSTNTYGFAQSASNRVEKNMADPLVLTNFLDYCTNNYPADHYLLMFWNHGDGPKSGPLDLFQYGSTQNGILKSICQDVTAPGNDYLYIQELYNAINASDYFSTHKVDIIGFDACLMGSVEIAYKLRNNALYMTGSMALENGVGLPYDLIIGAMDSPTLSGSPEALGSLIVQAYKDYYTDPLDPAGETNNAQTMSAIDLSQMDNLKARIDDLAIAMVQEDKESDLEALRDKTAHFFLNEYDGKDIPYYDLNDFCNYIVNNYIYFSYNLSIKAQAVIDSLSTAILAAYGGKYYGYYNGPGYIVKRGLYIVFPLGDRELVPPDTGYNLTYLGWYTNTALIDAGANNSPYGSLDFCSFNGNGIVEGWAEMIGYWYDPDRTIITYNVY
ncbi:MAG: hypothetical protein JW969_11805 [Spirochaetales bacterium]|nr:hypothetical protein [Spirochaetales bacterium]